VSLVSLGAAVMNLGVRRDSVTSLTSVACGVESSVSLVSLGAAVMNLGVRRDSVTSLTSHNKQTFHRLLGSFRSAVASRDDAAADTLPACECYSGLSLITCIAVDLILIVIVILHDCFVKEEEE